LHRESGRRIADISSWIAPLLPIRDSAFIILKMLREGAKPVKHVAHQGAFSQILGGKLCQLVRIGLPLDAQFIPEISANKYALNVRFSTFGTYPRPRACEADVEFELTFCNL
jgi:cell division protein ZapD